MKHILIAFLFLSTTACFGQNILLNSDFSQTNYGWQTNGSFHYDSQHSSCNSCSGYAYFANSDGTAVNSAVGQLSQTVTIPASTSSATFSFFYSIHTSEPLNTTNDLLLVDFYVGGNGVWRVITLSNASATTTAGGLSNYQMVTASIPPSLIGQTVTVVFTASNNASNPTVFRVDDVQLNVVQGPAGPSTGYITWTDGYIPSDNAFVAAAEYLGSQGMIERNLSYNQITTNNSFTVVNASVLALNAIYHQNIPDLVPSDFTPTFFADIDGLAFNEKQAIKAMCFLEYGDGRPCLSREYTKIQPHSLITTGNVLRMLYEAWNMPINTSGFNILDSSPSSFLQNVNKNDYNYGYFQQAIADGVLGDSYSNGSIQNLNQNVGRFFYIVLANVVGRRGSAPIADPAYYNPNNVQLNNANTSTDITRGVFKTYEQSGLSLPSGGLGLNFVYSYHSDWTDLPLLGYNHYGLSNGNYYDWRAKERNFPLGIGWTHAYNITAQGIQDEQGNDKYVIIRWGDGSLLVYNVTANQFANAGVKDVFLASGNVNGHITGFSIRTKDQVTTQFILQAANDAYLNNLSYYVATQISDANGNTLNLNYEGADCNNATQCDGTSNLRLNSVTDIRANRSLHFYYHPGTDLLQSVADGSRTIQFNVNPYTLNLDSEINARGYTTKYVYGTSDVDNHLLTSIQRPRGNTITNTYINRKLSQIQTPDYVATIKFAPTYPSANFSTQSTVLIGPTTDNQYSIQFSQNTAGLTTTVSSASSNVSYTYADVNNPTLPTDIVDNNTGLRQLYIYDSNGNVLDSYYKSPNNTVSNHYTYNSRNEVLTHTWPNNTVTTYTYDDTGNKLTEATSGSTNQFGPNGDGTIGFSRDAEGVWTGYDYNEFGNLNGIASSVNAQLVRFTAKYDPQSRLSSTTDGNGHVTKYGFDPNNNLESIIKDETGLNIRTTYEYDENDNVKLITPPSNNSPIAFSPTSLTYNKNDQLASEQQGKYVRNWYYNSDGTLSSYVQKNGASFPYTYFPKGNPNEGKVQSNGFQTFTYDNTKRTLTQVATSRPDNGTIRYAYDDLLRPFDVILNTPTFQSEIAHTYDVSGNLKNLTLVNEGRSLSYDYDEFNRITYIRDWNGNAIIHYNYLKNGLLAAAELSNGAVTHYHYDTANRLDSIYCVQSNSNTLLYAVGCSMDNNGNHTRESLFVKWEGPGGVPVPPTHSTATYDQYSRLDAINGKSVNNDDLGNITSNNSSYFSDAVYDPISHLTSCTVDGKSRQFLYDALGNRYGVDSMQYTVDALDNGNVLAEKKLGQNLASQLYIHSPYGLVCSIDPQTATPTFYLYDFRGSTVATLGLNAVVTSHYRYDPWGNITYSSIASGKPTPFLFVGQYGVMYESPHLYYMRARYYDPTIGRFLGEDSNWTTNLFSYAENNPVKRIDPFGTVSTFPGVNIEAGVSGIYEFVAASGKLYIGQSVNILRRLAEHVRSGKLLQEDINTFKYRIVKGLKANREVQEQIRINQEGGIKSGKLENIRDPIGPGRANLLEDDIFIEL